MRCVTEHAADKPTWSARQPLPNRRAHFIDRPIEWAGVVWLVGVGLDNDGCAIEVFADLADAAVEVEPAIVHLVHEASITASHLLQHGVAAAAHAARLDAPSPGLLCLMLRRAAATEAELGGPVRELGRMIEERRRTARVVAREFAIAGNDAEGATR